VLVEPNAVDVVPSDDPNRPPLVFGLFAFENKFDELKPDPLLPKPKDISIKVFQFIQKFLLIILNESILNYISFFLNTIFLFFA